LLLLTQAQNSMFVIRLFPHAGYARYAELLHNVRRAWRNAPEFFIRLLPDVANEQWHRILPHSTMYRFFHKFVSKCCECTLYELERERHMYTPASKRKVLDACGMRKTAGRT